MANGGSHNTALRCALICSFRSASFRPKESASRTRPKSINEQTNKQSDGHGLRAPKASLRNEAGALRHLYQLHILYTPSSAMVICIT